MRPLNTRIINTIPIESSLLTWKQILGTAGVLSNSSRKKEDSIDKNTLSFSKYRIRIWYIDINYTRGYTLMSAFICALSNLPFSLTHIRSCKVQDRGSVLHVDLVDIVFEHFSHITLHILSYLKETFWIVTNNIESQHSLKRVHRYPQNQSVAANHLCLHAKIILKSCLV